MFVGFKSMPELSSRAGIYLIWGSQASSEECELCKAARLYLAKGPCAPLLLHPDTQLQYQGTWCVASCTPPFTSHRVRASSRSVWSGYVFSRSRHVAVLARRACDCSATVGDLWLLLVLTPVACFEFLLSTMLCRRGSEIFLPACRCLMARGTCLLSSLVWVF